MNFIAKRLDTGLLSTICIMSCTVHMDFPQQMPYFPLILQFLAVAVVYNLMTYQSSGNPVSFYKTYPEFSFSSELHGKLLLET